MRDPDAFGRALDSAQIIVGALIVLPIAVVMLPLWIPLRCATRFVDWYIEGGRR